MRRVIVVLLILCVASVQVGIASGEWEEDTSSSYRWIYDFSENEEEIKSMIEQEDIEITLLRNHGGYVFLYTIEYKGEENDMHRFDYMGGYYSEGRIHYSMELEREGMSASGELMMGINKVEIDFEGSLWMKEYEYDVDPEPTSAYGIVRQTLITTGSVDVEADMEVKLQDETVELTMDYVLKNYWDLELDINYDPPLPFFPTTSEGDSHDIILDVEAGYNGDLEGDIDLAMDYESSLGSDDIKLEQNVSMPMENTEMIEAKLLFQHDNIYRKISPVIGCISIGNTAMIKYTTRGIYSEDEGVIGNSIGIPSEGRFDEQELFYGSNFKYAIDHFYFEPPIRIVDDFFEDDFSFLKSEMIESESVSKEEVETFRDNKKEYFEEYVEAAGVPSWLLYIIIPVIIFTFMVVIWVVLFSRKKKRPKIYYPTDVKEDE